MQDADLFALARAGPAFNSPLSEARARRAGYERGYRGLLGFAYVLGSASS